MTGVCAAHSATNWVAIIGALVAARYWFASAREPLPRAVLLWEEDPEKDPFIGALRRSAELNRIAATLSGISALLAAISALLGLACR